MGATKYEFYTDDLIKTAELIKALAHPARLKAVLMIVNEIEKDITIEDVSKEVKLSQSTLSVHFKQLHDSGFIKTAVVVEKKCRNVFRGNKPATEHLVHLLEYVLSKIELKIDDRSSNHPFYSKQISVHDWNRYFEVTRC